MYRTLTPEQADLFSQYRDSLGHTMLDAIGGWLADDTEREYVYRTLKQRLPHLRRRLANVRGDIATAREYSWAYAAWQSAPAEKRAARRLRVLLTAFDRKAQCIEQVSRNAGLYDLAQRARDLEEAVWKATNLFSDANFERSRAARLSDLESVCDRTDALLSDLLAAWQLVQDPKTFRQAVDRCAAGLPARRLHPHGAENCKTCVHALWLRYRCGSTCPCGHPMCHTYQPEAPQTARLHHVARVTEAAAQPETEAAAKTAERAYQSAVTDGTVDQLHVQFETLPDQDTTQTGVATMTEHTDRLTAQQQAEATCTAIRERMVEVRRGQDGQREDQNALWHALRSEYFHAMTEARALAGLDTDQAGTEYRLAAEAAAVMACELCQRQVFGYQTVRVGPARRVLCKVCTGDLQAEALQDVQALRNYASQCCAGIGECGAFMWAPAGTLANPSPFDPATVYPSVDIRQRARCLACAAPFCDDCEDSSPACGYCGAERFVDYQALGYAHAPDEACTQPVTLCTLPADLAPFDAARYGTDGSLWTYTNMRGYLDTCQCDHCGAYASAWYACLDGRDTVCDDCVTIEAFEDLSDEERAAVEAGVEAERQLSAEAVERYHARTSAATEAL